MILFAMHYLQPKTMKLYIISEVLSDYTSGMCVIAAENLDQCREIFIKKFSYDEYAIKEYDAAIRDKDYKELEVLNVEPGLIDYVCGGG